MTLNEIEQDIYRMTAAEAGTPVTATQTRVRANVNKRYRWLLAKLGEGEVRDFQTTLASVANQTRYAFGRGVSRVNRIYETTNDVALVEKTLEWLRTVDPDPQSGTPEYWIPIGWQPVSKQPANASEIFVKSTSASDTGTCYIEVLRTGQMPRTLSVTMTGVTAVSLGTAITDAEQITKFFVSAAAVGRISLHEDSGAGTELGVIPIGQTAGRYYIVQLYPTPGAAVTYQVDVTAQIPDLAQANDEPLLPLEFHYLLSVGARLDEYEKSDDSRYDTLEKQWDRGWREMRAHVQFPPGYQPVIGMMAIERRPVYLVADD